jgi:hypothetical protein
MRMAGMPSTRTSTGASIASLFLAVQFARFSFSFWCDVIWIVLLIID